LVGLFYPVNPGRSGVERLQRRDVSNRPAVLKHAVGFTTLRWLHARTFGHHLRIETLDILAMAQLGAWRQDSSGAGGHAEHERILYIFSAGECDSHAGHKTIACSHGTHRSDFGAA
jgi:hypothetical protein